MFTVIKGACMQRCDVKFNLNLKHCLHGSGRVVSASGSETSVSSSTYTSAIIYDAYTSVIKKYNIQKKKKKNNLLSIKNKCNCLQNVDFMTAYILHLHLIAI